MQPATDILRLEEISVAYGASRRRKKVYALHDVSFSITAGEVLGLAGESGCGKSTLARAVAGLTPLSEGRIIFDGQIIADANDKRLRRSPASHREIQLVFQDAMAALNPRRTLEQSLLEPLAHFSIGSADSRVYKVEEALKIVQLDASLKHRLPAELSGGQRQRAALARAIITQPRLLIADEPVSSLDVSVQRQILELLRELARELNIAILLISHDLGVLHELATRIVVMHQGQIVESGDVEQVLQRPEHACTQALLAARALADPTAPAPRSA